VKIVAMRSQRGKPRATADDRGEAWKLAVLERSRRIGRSDRR
jgi:hypothetical protein